MNPQLPAEILQYIASFLPTSSAACFALSSKYYAYILGEQYFRLLRGMYSDRKGKRSFLLLLERDLPTSTDASTACASTITIVW